MTEGSEASDTPRPAAWRSVDGERLIALFSSLVEPLGQSLPAGTEVVLHDHALVPNSIVAMYGSVSGRKVGDPSNSLLLERVTAAASDQSYLGYEVRLADGRRLRSSAIIIRDLGGNAVGTLSITVDITVWETVEKVARSMLGGQGSVPLPPLAALTTALVQANDVGAEETAASVVPDASTPRGVDFVSDVDQVALLIIAREVDGVGKPVESMKKADKLAVVRRLKARGVFLIKDSVNQVAEALGVTRFTIYNYLNEIEGED